MKYLTSVKMITSGGQTGADVGGLECGLLLGIPTGGWMPRGWRTLNGARPEYQELYGMKEHIHWQYPPRTYANVKEADVTIRFAADFNSPGEKCTLKAIRQYKKPHFDVCIDSPASVRDCRKWLISSGAKILNIAGNSESTCPGIRLFVIKYI